MLTTNLPGTSGLRRAALAVFAFSLILVSCTEQSSQSESATGPEKKTLSLNCVTLSRQQMQVWVDSGWTRPDNPGRIRTLLLQFYSADAANLNKNLQLIAYPGMSVTDVKLNGNTLLAVDSSCKAGSFSGKIILANNEANLDSLGVFNTDGSLKEFEYIRFTPGNFGRNPEYISWNYKIVTKGGLEDASGGSTKPCPPYCCPPDCN